MLHWHNPCMPLVKQARGDLTRYGACQGKGQVSRARGLEKALRENQAHCSDAKLEQEHAARVADQERKVERRQRDLDEARGTGKAGKIADREAKLAKEKAELENCAEERSESEASRACIRRT